jgi:hypothetical protein
MKKIFLSALFFLSISLLHAQSKTENIIIVTLDGFRWEEVFGGADSALINDSTYVHDTASLNNNSGHRQQKKDGKNSFPFSGTRSNHRDSCMATGGGKTK